MAHPVVNCRIMDGETQRARTRWDWMASLLTARNTSEHWLWLRFIL